MSQKKFSKSINGKICFGTEFQLLVWTSISKIKKGETKTYLEVARLIGKPKSVRAVANACGKNPYPPLIPCHRVIRIDGKMGGYSGPGGITTKRRLLEQEEIHKKKIG